MVFTLAIVFAWSAHGVIIGGIIGLAVPPGIAHLMCRAGEHIDIGLFFKVLDGLPLVFAVGILVDAAQNLWGLGWVPWLTRIRYGEHLTP